MLIGGYPIRTGSNHELRGVRFYTCVKRTTRQTCYGYGGVAVYCDPRRYPKTIAVSPRFTVAIGCHPKTVTNLTPEKEQQLQQLLKHPRVALGYIGLDWTEPVQTWDLQRTVFRRLLSSSCTRRPLVLQLRDGRQNQGVLSRALEQVRRDCSQNQLIHLHCFTGDVEDLRHWQEAFPLCYFGFTGLVFQFSALRRVPSTRLLLETDSPHLHPEEQLTTVDWNSGPSCCLSAQSGCPSAGLGSLP